MGSINATLANPATELYSGASVAVEVPDLLPVGIAGHPYLVDLREYERTTIDALRPASDQSEEPGDQSLSTIGIWKRKGLDWRLGAGQPFFDDEQALQARFRVSKGIDIWTPNRIKLHKAADQKRSTGAGNVAVLSAGARLYIIDGSEIYHTPDPSVDSPSWTSAAINIGEGAQTVTSITTDGNFVYAAVGANGIHKTTIGASSSTHLSAYQAELVAYANGRLLAAKDNEIVEVAAAGTTTSLYTHLNPNVTIVAITPCPSGIYVALNNGDVGEFLYIGFNPTTGVLLTPVAAGNLNAGETVNAMVYYGRLKAIGTSRGLRMGELLQDHGLSPGPVIEDYGPVGAVAGRGEYVFFGITNLDSVSTGIGRADLSRFPGLPLVPAYATDMMAGDDSSAVQGTVQSVALFADKRYWAVNGSGVWGEHPTDLVPKGTISSGLIRFRSTEKKIVTNVDLRHEPLNGTIEAALQHEDGSLDTCGISSAPGTLSPPSQITCNEVESEFPELKLTLNRKSGDNTKGPVLKRWALRAMVVPIRTDAIVLPLILKSQIKTTNGQGSDYPYDDLLKEYLFLKSLEASRHAVTLQEGDLTQLVVIDQVRVKPEKWDHNRHWYEGTVYVRALAVNTTEGG